MFLAFELLSLDELEEEFLIRKINVRGPVGMQRLKESVEKELAGLMAKPRPLQSVRLNQELSVCREKFNLVELSFRELDRNDPTSNESLIVRLWHLESKARRLLEAFPGTDAASSLLNEITQFAKTTRASIAEEAGAVGGAASEPPPHYYSMDGQTEFRGFTPPSSRPNALDDFLLPARTINTATRDPPVQTTTSARPTNRASQQSLPSTIPTGPSSPNNDQILSERGPPRAFSQQQQQLQQTYVQQQLQPQQPYLQQQQEEQRPPLPQQQYFQQQQLPQQPYLQQHQQSRHHEYLQQRQLQDQQPQQTHRLNMGQIMARWSIRFPGNNNLTMDEFIFRVETLAEADGIPQASLILGLHLLLEKRAADVYWNHRRKYPLATWDHLKCILLERYATQESDIELRKSIADRRQLTGESFADFCLDIENLAARMRRPMDEGELIEYLRNNMSFRLQDALMLHPTFTIRELQSHCRRFERVWMSQSQFTRRTVGRVNEVDTAADMMPIEQPVNEATYTRMNNNDFQPVLIPDEINAIQSRVGAMHLNPSVNRAEYMVCWNCADLGHSFFDCVAPRTVFCYGCGAKNIYKPQCQNCHSGNGRRGGSNSGPSRTNPFAVARNPEATSTNQH